MPPRAILRKIFRQLPFALSEAATRYKVERTLFYERQGYPLNLKLPSSFSEKICWRKIYDRNALFPQIVDKYAVRNYLRNVLGDERAKDISLPLIFETKNPSRIPRDVIQENIVIKASHGSGMNMIIRKACEIDFDSIVDRCRQWLDSPYGYYMHEWAYQLVDRRIIVEPLVEGCGGRPPREYKFQMFHGKCQLIQVLNSTAWYDGVNYSGGGLPSLTYFTPEWSWLNVSWKYYWLAAEFFAEPNQSPPHNLDEMLSVAEQLSEPFDYIRVDLYESADGIKFGELTPYHLSGHGAITPREFDYELGSKWILPKRNRSQFV